MSASLPPLRPATAQWLLACARLRAPRERLPALTAAEWGAAVVHARQHSVAPLLRRLISARDQLDRLPAGARDALLALQHRTAFQNRLFAEENERLLLAFRDAQVPALIPKGLSLAERLYGDLALRPLLDLVFLVRAGQLEAAERVLQREGYRPVRRSRLDRTYRWTCPGRLWVRQGSMRLAAYVFTDLVNWPRFHGLEAEAVWRRARETSVCGAPAHIPAPEDQLLYLALQIDNNGFFNGLAYGRLPTHRLLFAPWSNNRVIRLADLCNFLDQEAGELDPEALLERARRSGLTIPLRLSLALVRDLFGTAPLPPLLPGADQPERVSALRRQLGAMLLRGDELPLRSPFARSLGVFVRALWRRSGSVRRGELCRLVALAETALPPASVFRTVRPGRRSRVVHLLGVLGRSARSLLRRERHDPPVELAAPPAAPASAKHSRDVPA